MAVFSSERILLESDDYFANKAGEYLESEEYQDRLLYEAYWIARTVYDGSYTKEARELLDIAKSPLDYFKDQPRREMEKI